MPKTLFGAPAAAAPAAFTVFDSLNQYASEKFGLPPAWHLVGLDRSPAAAPEGFARVEGAVCPLRPDGRPRWAKRDRATERVVFVDLADWRRWEEALAASRGVCRPCWGTGQELASVGVGGIKTRTCRLCGGTGKPAPAPAPPPAVGRRPPAGRRGRREGRAVTDAPSPITGRVLVWFSCGAASAVAAKVAVERYGKAHEVEVCYCDTSFDEDPDNQRFRLDVEKWIGRPVKVLRHPRYKSVEEVWRAKQYIVGVRGASCTRVLKREVREAYQRPDDAHVFGLTADERDRIDNLEERNPDLRLLWVLAAAGITKEDCYHTLTAHGIELPAMYLRGYNTNNCRGCCKGGKGYWNKIRRDFPDVFASRAKVQREIGCGFNSGGKLFFLDELGPDEGLDVPEPPIDCGLFCTGYAGLVELAVSAGKAKEAEHAD